MINEPSLLSNEASLVICGVYIMLINASEYQPNIGSLFTGCSHSNSTVAEDSERISGIICRVQGFCMMNLCPCTRIPPGEPCPGAPRGYPVVPCINSSPTTWRSYLPAWPMLHRPRFRFAAVVCLCWGMKERAQGLTMMNQQPFEFDQLLINLLLNND